MMAMPRVGVTLMLEVKGRAIVWVGVVVGVGVRVVIRVGGRVKVRV